MQAGLECPVQVYGRDSADEALPRHVPQAACQRFIELKNSSLDLVFFILSSRNSIAATIFYHPTQQFFEDFDLPRQSRTLCL